MDDAEREENRMAAQPGDTVRIHYTGKLVDGVILESSRNQEPFELLLGAGQVIRGLEHAIEGMKPGESKHVDIPVNEAFGARQPDLIVEIDRAQLRTIGDPEVGQEVTLDGHKGHPISAVVTDVSPSAVTVDANHPLAGEDLAFDIELVEIV